MSTNVVVKPATVGDRILISTESHSDCVAVNLDEVSELIAELEEYRLVDEL